MTLQTFSADGKSVDAVAFAVLIVGEAATHVPAEVRKVAPEVPWKQMAAMRTVVAHEYFGLDRGVLWETATKDIPALVPLLKELLARS